MIGERPACIDCKNLISVRGAKCKAFPDGIPEEIWIGGNDHKKPVEGDHGIRFELDLNNL